MNKKILVVDDSPTDNQALCLLVKANGFEFLSASSGEDALKMAVTFKPNLILMDVVMPGMNGFQACKALGKDPITSAIPVLMVSNKHQDTDVIWAQKQGAKGYFAKPINEKELFVKIRELTAGF